MNGPGDIPATHSSTPDTKACSLVSIIPTLGMSSCRGRAEAFARSLSSKLRTLGSQADEDDAISPENEPIMNGGNGGATLSNTWMTTNASEHVVTDLQPLRHESDSFFDFDCELESPGSPVDECEYLRLIETASNTPHNSAAESGYVCASAASSQGSDGPYFDVINSEHSSDTQDYVKSLKINGTAEKLTNGFEEHIDLEDKDEEQQHNDNKQTQETATDILPPAMDAEQKASAAVNGDSPESLSNELSVSEMAKVQDQIISELQQQSVRYNSPTSEVEQTETTASRASPVTVTPTEIDHAIVNGYAENGEETLNIEMTEVDRTPKQETAELSNELVKQENEESEPANDAAESSSSAPDSDKDSNKSKNQHSNVEANTDDDDDECRPQRVRRCSSLKTGKTPPGTPGRKKIVRFADVLGLDLADVKTFLDEVPTIPKSAFEDLEIMESEPPLQLGPKADKILVPLFQQPGGLPTFLDLVREKQVSLENAAVTDHINHTITGTVRVRNLDFNKSVHIRYTLDGWRSFADLKANYVENSCDGFSDKFSYVLFGNSLQIGQRLEFAVRFQCKGQQFWDSNYGINYCFQCLPTTTPLNTPITPILPSHHTSSGLMSPSVGEAWCNSFY